MRTCLRRTSLALAALAAAACAEAARDPLSPVAGPGEPRTTTTLTSDVWDLADVDALFGAGMYSLDTTRTGNSARLYIAPDGWGDETPTICRDHFSPIDLWWDGGDGIATFHIDPPLLFVGYRSGTFQSGVLRFRRAIYETLQASEATDPVGNVWRFRGRFNALCRQGELEIGPIAFRGQIVRSQDPIDRPVLVRRADSGCDGGGDTRLIEHVEYNPYDPMAAGSGTDAGGCAGTGSGAQYQPGDYTGGETVDWGTGQGNGGTSVCGNEAMVEYVCIDVYNEETGFWEEWGCGYVTTC